MTKGEEQQSGWQGGNPNTFNALEIEKFGGMNTVSPRGVFGQPNWLENIVLDRMGGYASAPSPRDVLTLPSTIVGAAPLDGISRVFIKTASGATLVDLTTGGILHTYVTPNQNIAPYERGAIISWDTGNAQANIIALTLNAEGGVTATDLIGKPSFQFSFVEVDQYVSGGGGVIPVTTAPEDPGTTVFEDTFDRANGGLGSNWVNTSLTIASNRVTKPADPPVASAYANVALAAAPANWHQFSATLTEGGGLIFYASQDLTRVFVLTLTAGRSVQVLENGNVLASLGVAPGTDPVRVTATFSGGGAVVGFGTTTQTLRLDPPPRFGIYVSGTGTVDLFRYSKKNILTETTTPGTTIEMTDARAYQAGTRYGFDPRTSHYVMLYPQPYSYTAKPKLGTTLNPRPSSPSKIRPIILYIPPFPGGLQREYKIVFQNPGNADFHVYGASKSPRRPYTEYTGQPIDKALTRTALKGVQVKEGTLTVAAPTSTSGIRLSAAGYADIRMLYQAVNTGTSDPKEPLWPDVVGATVQDGTVTWVNRGVYYSTGRDFLFSEYIARVSSPPVDYLSPEIEWTPISNDFGEWAQLHAEGAPGGAVQVYRSRDDTPYPFFPHSFFPVGRITELHQARTWVVADAVWRTYAQNAGSAPYTELDRPFWEAADNRRTVYYSEPDAPWQFLERFIHLPLDKSRGIVAMRSVGDYLVFLGDSDGVVLAGDSEANFYAQPLDVPGAFSQDTTAVYQGALYYRGVGGIYRLSGGRAEPISAPIANLIPERPQIEESMTVDDRHARLLVKVAEGQVLCYDMAADGWSVLNLPGKLLQIGKTAYLADGATLKAVDGPPNQEGVIRYRDVSGGAGHVRKQLRSVSLTAEAVSIAAKISLSTQAHRPNANVSGYSAHKEHAVDQRTKFLQWRTPNRAGYAFDLELKINPAGGEFVVKPGIALEMYPEAEIRSGY